MKLTIRRGRVGSRQANIAIIMAIIKTKAAKNDRKFFQFTTPKPKIDGSGKT